MRLKLFDYQVEMRERILGAFGKHDAVMCQMPTGTGKTHVLAAVVNEYAKRASDFQNGNTSSESAPITVWVVAHRRELIEQIQRTWKIFYHGKRNAPDVRVMSIQWLAKNWEKVADERPAMIVIDEAHHALADTYQELFQRYPEAKKLGMTATPYRLSGKGFVGLFDTLLQSYCIPEFIAMKRLSLFDYYAVPQDSKIRRQIALLKKRGADGDYQTKELELSLNTPRNIEYLYNSLMRYAKGRRGIVYAININHARAIADFYAAKGLKCCAIDCNTPQKERGELVEAFRSGDIDVMVNVDIFSEGFDCPEVEFIQLARPTLSLAVYLQQVGRGLRKAKGKKYCVILDNVGLSRTFGTPIRKWQWDKMFEGKAGNIRIDAGDNRELIKHFGYPGNLADEPMEMLSSHEDMDMAIKHEGLLVYDSKDTLIGIKLKGRIVSRKPVLKVLAYKDDTVALRMKDLSTVLIFPSGQELKMPSELKDFEIFDNKLLRIVTKRSSYFLDLITNLTFKDCPSIDSYGPMTFLNDGTQLWRRVPDYRCAYDDLHGDTCWNSYYLKTYGICPISRNAFIPSVEFGEVHKIDYSPIALFLDETKPYYLAAELPNKSIIVVDTQLHYYLVKPDQSRKYLFTATSYQRSKLEFEQWTAKLTK